MTGMYDDPTASTDAYIKRQLENRETYQCLRCKWHSVNASTDARTCPNFAFYSTCYIRDAILNLPQEGECGYFEEAGQ